MPSAVPAPRTSSDDFFGDRALGCLAFRTTAMDTELSEDSLSELEEDRLRLLRILTRTLRPADWLLPRRRRRSRSSADTARLSFPRLWPRAGEAACPAVRPRRAEAGTRTPPAATDLLTASVMAFCTAELSAASGSPPPDPSEAMLSAGCSAGSTQQTGVAGASLGCQYGHCLVLAAARPQAASV